MLIQFPAKHAIEAPIDWPQKSNKYRHPRDWRRSGCFITYFSGSRCILSLTNWSSSCICPSFSITTPSSRGKVSLSKSRSTRSWLSSGRGSLFVYLIDLLYSVSSIRPQMLGELALADLDTLTLFVFRILDILYFFICWLVPLVPLSFLYFFILLIGHGLYLGITKTDFTIS